MMRNIYEIQPPQDIDKLVWKLIPVEVQKCWSKFNEDLKKHIVESVKLNLKQKYQALSSAGKKCEDIFGTELRGEISCDFLTIPVKLPYDQNNKDHFLYDDLTAILKIKRNIHPMTRRPFSIKEILPDPGALHRLNEKADAALNPTTPVQPQETPLPSQQQATSRPPAQDYDDLAARRTTAAAQSTQEGQKTNHDQLSNNRPQANLLNIWNIWIQQKRTWIQQNLWRNLIDNSMIQPDERPNSSPQKQIPFKISFIIKLFEELQNQINAMIKPSKPEQQQKDPVLNNVLFDLAINPNENLQDQLHAPIQPDERPNSSPQKQIPFKISFIIKLFEKLQNQINAMIKPSKPKQQQKGPVLNNVLFDFAINPNENLQDQLHAPIQSNKPRNNSSLRVR